MNNEKHSPIEPKPKDEMIKELACDFFWDNQFDIKEERLVGYQSIRQAYDRWLSESTYHKNKPLFTLQDMKDAFAHGCFIERQGRLLYEGINSYFKQKFNIDI